jgi:hypothetical protein
MMIRQCAWCLRLMDEVGIHISQHPLPKIYEATHGICSTCGLLWLQRVADDLDAGLAELWRDEHADCDTSAQLPVIEVMRLIFLNEEQQRC